MNHYDQFYALHVFEKATTRADVWLYAIFFISLVVIGVTA